MPLPRCSGATQKSRTAPRGRPTAGLELSPMETYPTGFPSDATAVKTLNLNRSVFLYRSKSSKILWSAFILSRNFLWSSGMSCQLVSESP